MTKTASTNPSIQYRAGALQVHSTGGAGWLPTNTSRNGIITKYSYINCAASSSCVLPNPIMISIHGYVGGTNSCVSLLPLLDATSNRYNVTILHLTAAQIWFGRAPRSGSIYCSALLPYRSILKLEPWSYFFPAVDLVHFESRFTLRLPLLDI